MKATDDKRIVIGIGELLWDRLPGGKKIGGAPANFVHHVEQFGLAACAVSALGDDAEGRELRDTMQALGLNAEAATVGYPTGSVDVTFNAAGVPTYNIIENVAWDHIPFTDRLAALAKRASAVCFGTLAQRSAESRETIRRFLDATPADALRIFDINLRQHFYSKEIADDSLRRCNVLKVSDEEFPAMREMLGLRSDDLRDDCRELIRRYDLRMLILTCGAKGSYVFAPGKEEPSFAAAPKVDVADTVGAGDSFTATFTASLLKGASIEEAHRFASEVSAYVCTCCGAMPRLPLRLLAPAFSCSSSGLMNGIMRL